MIRDTAKAWLHRIMGLMGLRKMPTGTGWGFSGGLTGFSVLGSTRKQVEAYQGHVYKCVTLIYRRAGGVGMDLYKERGEGEEKVTRHPFIDLMRRPNPYMTGRDLKAVTFMHRDLTGKAFWLKIFNRLGRPVELWPLPVGNFSRILFDSAGSEVTGFEFATDRGDKKIYAPEEIVYFRYPHPLYLLEGASPIQAQAFAYDIDLAMRMYQRNFFQNSARPDTVLTTEQEIQPEDARRLLIAWKQAHQGVANAFEPALLDRGLDVKVLSVNAKDAEFAVMAGWTKEDIFETYNVPPGKLGTVKDVNRANALGIDITFNSECITPRLDSYEDAINHSLMPHYDAGLFVKHENCVPRDLEFELKARESNLKSKFTTINEERAREGYDEVAWGNVPWIAINEIQFGESLEMPGQASISDELRVTSKGRREAARVLHERKVAARSRALRAWLRKFFKKQKAEVLTNLAANFNGVEGVIAGMSLKKTKAWLEAHKDETDRILFDMTEANQDLTEGMGPYIENALIDEGGEALAGVGAVDVVFDIFSLEASTWMGLKLPKIRDINRTTRDMLEKEIRAGFEAGESMQTIAGRIEKIFENADKVRSLRIAQTEVNTAANFGTLEGYRQSGVVEKKEWIAGPGARDTHAEAEARYTGKGAIPIGEDFQVGDGRGPAPGNIGLPEEDINCRCSILPVIKSE